uniref:mitogen-activated protein kinase kinase n=1 Tax=Heterorhabditis bacteriophora TaxID=37862 RepID=A0A1I7XHJ7_HETBA
MQADKRHFVTDEDEDGDRIAVRGDDDLFITVHVPSDRIIAVKCLAVDENISKSENVLREMTLMRKCNTCEFIVDLLGAAVESNILSICLEYMDGGALGQYGR